MAQETGLLLRWLKAPGEMVNKGEPLMEIETDKAAVEVESPASGRLANVTAQPGDEIPVGQVIAVILAPEETMAQPSQLSLVQDDVLSPSDHLAALGDGDSPWPAPVASPVAARMAAEHQIDLNQISSDGRRIQKADVLAYLEAQADGGQRTAVSGRLPASPKARRLAAEQGLDLAAMAGSGPDGAVLAADVAEAQRRRSEETRRQKDEEAKLKEIPTFQPANLPTLQTLTMSKLERIAAQRLTQSWTTVPHFYLVREANVSQFILWREKAQQQTGQKITYTDLLVKVVAVALRQHPRLNAGWQEGSVVLNQAVNIGLAVAVDQGLVVPVIQQADTLPLSLLSARRQELAAKAQAGMLSLADLSSGTFTISNLGMYGVDAFNAIINLPQVAILAVSRIADRVTPVNGQPAVQPMLTLTLSCDHRVVDGARGAQFLQTLVSYIEEPLRLLD
jgi:pyruvate dehydrogenase E2 component (dihydrolipoamide acetyltransferase)